MDKLERYRKFIKQILQEHSNIKPAYGEIEMQLLFDEERDRYQVVRSGWLQDQRVYGVLVQMDIKEEKIWIQYDGTEVGVANELTDLGVPKDEIVLAYHSPFMRQYDGFAVG